MEVQDQGPDWYCNYCDKMVPHVDSKAGRHDEAKGGCGNALSSCKLDPSALPAGWLREEVARAVTREKQIANSHRCTCHLRDPGADDVQPGLAPSQSQQ